MRLNSVRSFCDSTVSREAKVLDNDQATQVPMISCPKDILKM